MVSYGEGFIIFGGIQDITHEKDDVYYYEIPQRQWILLENDSTHGKSLSPTKKTGLSFADDKSESIRRTSGRNFTVKGRASISPFGRRQTRAMTDKRDRESLSPGVNGYSPSSKGSPSGSFLAGHSFGEGMSPTKNALAEVKEEKKKKMFQMKKNMLLQQFEVHDPTIKQALTQKSPTTESMKNSIIAINYKRDGQSPEKEREKTESESPGRRGSKKKGVTFFADVSKYQVPVDGKLVGHKPCARDGHSAFIIRNKMLVFGGDRHKMSFNDVYILSVDPLLKSARGSP